MMLNYKSILHKVTARNRRNPYYGRLLEIGGSSLKGRKWIFIMGCYNSGTTLLNQILANHPDIGGLPDEGVMLTTQLVKPEDFGWRRMWWQCIDEMQNSPINLNKKSKVIKKHWSHFYGNQPFLLEKSISNICRIPFFNSEFQPAYFIHIVRNGYAVAEGIRRKAEVFKGNPYYEQSQYPIDLCINQWVESLKMMESNKNDLQYFMEISYEQLTDNTDVTLGKLTNFMGLTPFNSNILNKSFSIHEKKESIQNMNIKSIKRLSEKEIKIINEIGGPYLLKYNYPIL